MNLIIHILSVLALFIILTLLAYTPFFGLIATGILAVALLLFSLTIKPLQHYLILASYVPIALVVSLSFPISEYDRIMVVYGVLLTVSLSLLLRSYSVRAAITLIRSVSVPEYLLFIIAGVTGGTGLYLLDRFFYTQFLPLSVYLKPLWQQMLLVPIIVVAEELFFRKLILSDALRFRTGYLVLISTSVIGASLFVPSGVSTVYFAYYIHLFLATLYAAKNNIWLNMLVSFCIKVTVILLYQIL